MNADDVDRFFLSVGSRRSTRAPGEANSDAVFLRAFGQRLRAARAKLKMPRRLLADEAGVSARYIRSAEAGEGNVSLRILRTLAHSLATDPLDLLEERPNSALHRLADRLDEAQREEAYRILTRHFSGRSNLGRLRRIALVGLPGSGKTVLGQRLAAEMGVPFVAFDDAVASAAGAPVSDVFRRFSHAAVQRLQRRVLEQLLAGEGGVVIAVGGGVATMPQTLAMLVRGCRTIWLRQASEDVARGVAGGLDEVQTRDLRALMAAQEAMFTRADVVLDTAGRSAEEVFEALLGLVV